MDASANDRYHHRSNRCLRRDIQVQSHTAEELVVVSVAVACEATQGKLSKEQTSKNRKEVTHVKGHDSQHAIHG